MNKKRSIHELFLNTFQYDRQFGNVEEQFFWITGRYMTSERHYHNIEHIQDMLNNLLDFQENFNWHSYEYDFVALKKAIWGHDVIYVPGSKTNEEDSVKWCELHGYRKFANFDTIKNLIMATKTHQSDDPTEQLIIDLDLYGLCSKEYDLNSQNIRKEFSKFKTREFYEGRAKWLKQFLARPKIYLNKDFSNPEMEQLARNNMAYELEFLEEQLYMYEEHDHES